MKFFLLLFTIVISWCFLMAENQKSIEVGEVKWNRNWDQAFKISAEKNKPILTLFQEVPGCSGCQKFGKNVLSHPLLVEAIETEFVPVLVYNNRSGKDAGILKKYREPSWNFQVIRFFDSSGKDIIPRRDRIWTIGGVAKRMCQTLEESKKEVPFYLQNLSQEYDNPNIKEVAFAMYCFWTGEMELGAIDGVIKTEAGFFDGREVTRVWFDSKTISLAKLIARAAGVKCANKVYVSSKEDVASTTTRLQVQHFDIESYRKAPFADQKRQIQGTAFMKLNLTLMQLCKINAFARKNMEKAWTYLSPTQQRKLKKR